MLFLCVVCCSYFHYGVFYLQIQLAETWKTNEMPLSFEKANKEAFDTYISVMRAPTTPKNLSIMDILELGKQRCIALGVNGNNDPDNNFKGGNTRGYDWAKKNKPFMYVYNEYLSRGLFPQDKPFSLGLLNDEFQGLISTDLQYKVMTQSMHELNALHITPTVRMIKWIVRFAHTPYIPKEYSFLKTIGYGSVAPRDNDTGKINMPFVMGICDMALIYEQKERASIKDNIDTRWDSSELDKKFFMPVSAQLKLSQEPLTFSFPYLDPNLQNHIQLINKERYQQTLFTENDDANYRDQIWTLIDNDKTISGGI